MPSILLNHIASAPVYIREKFNKDHAADMAAFFKQSGTEIPTITLAKIPDKPTSKHFAKLLEQGFKYVIVDGTHRYYIAKGFGFESINATVSNVNPESADYLAEQYTLNNRHGLKLSNEERFRYMTILRDQYKLTVENIAGKTGFSKASVSRILKNGGFNVATPDTKGKGTKKRQDGRKGTTEAPTPDTAEEGTTVLPGASGNGFSCKQWWEAFMPCMQAFNRNEEAVLLWLESHATEKAALGGFLRRGATIVSASQEK